MSLTRLISHAMNGLAALLVAIALFVALANVGVIARPSSHSVTFGG